ncbi:hypothetical protein [Streptomyces sp. NPDC001389]|uniref:hypothetical protein n=1 Tax=unclassified Streptomyces TaxID=2593676 RepID=UPI0036BA918C
MSRSVSDSPQHRIFAMLDVDVDVDVDGDGVVTQAEYLGRVERVASAMGRDPDADGDHLLDGGACLAGIRAFVTTGSPPMAASYGPGRPLLDTRGR